eukprot:3337429-Rhodomonas_salina.2
MCFCQRKVENLLPKIPPFSTGVFSCRKVVPPLMRDSRVAIKAALQTLLQHPLLLILSLIFVNLLRMTAATIPEFSPPGVLHEAQRDWKGTRHWQDLRKTMPKVDGGPYYACYHGHKVEHLVRARDILAQRGCRSASVDADRRVMR